MAARNGYVLGGRTTELGELGAQTTPFSGDMKGRSFDFQSVQHGCLQIFNQFLSS